MMPDFARGWEKLISNLETQGNDDMIADEAAYAYRYAARKLREVMK